MKNTRVTRTRTRKIMVCFFGVMMTLLNSLPVFAHDKPLVVFANPADQHDVFYQLMTGFMQAAANDLDFELEVYYGNRNHVLIDENVNAIFQRERLPQYIVGMNARGSGKSLLDQAEALGIKTVFINQSFLGEERTRMGMPGEVYSQWLFEYLPDDVHSGYLLAKTLIDAALAAGKADFDGKLHMIGISGHAESSASTLREQGLVKAVDEYPNVILHQVVDAGWKEATAQHHTLRLLERYPETSVVWSASDLMAEGAAKAIRMVGKSPGKDILTGGVDWADLAMDNIQTGQFSASVGGHFMDGGWALVMLYDSLHGVDVPSFSRSKFSVLTQDNMSTYRDHFGDHDWEQIDFKLFSRSHNPQLSQYDFSLDSVLRQLK